VIEGDDSSSAAVGPGRPPDFAVGRPPAHPRPWRYPSSTGEHRLGRQPGAINLAGCGSIAARELCDEDFVLPIPPFNIRVHLTDRVPRPLTETKVPYRARSVQALKKLRAAGLRATAMPDLSAGGQSRDGLSVIEIEDGLTRDLT